MSATRALAWSLQEGNAMHWVLDHAPVVEYNKDTPRSKFFRFENHWLQISEMRQLISSSWNRGTRYFSSNSPLINYYKLRRIRAAIRQWARSKSSLQTLLANNKYVIQHSDAVEERRKLSTLEFV